MADALFLQGAPVLTAEELSVLQSLGQVLRRPPGHLFMRQGEQSDFTLLINEGHVKVVAGEPPRLIAIRGPGDMVGQMAALRHQPRSAGIIALDEVVVLHVPGDDWLRFLYDHPRAMHAQLIAAHTQLDQATRKIVESDLAVERRLAKALIELADTGLGHPSADGTTLPISQRDLATFTGASIDSIKKIIRIFKVRQLITTGRQHLVIRDIANLRAIADGTHTITP
ncbi:MAG TPA: Crp/Fnr family transcriptional regulator [Actinophytocola sp.]|uniref:Crp/Fnr family transcriptional regulator n=1 Tax=Actinophytocola sp. TaxID=1872138 RepID=UPI002DBD2BC8|nr:Crp/Fnr family transcriptional regulator [Actinophytocola sp.]HEU5470655.1 Crp/Fnr family transcriptional regulator [Actinophytocola sp.]